VWIGIDSAYATWNRSKWLTMLSLPGGFRLVDPSGSPVAVEAADDKQLLSKRPKARA
jgi:hypothetical protein